LIAGAARGFRTHSKSYSETIHFLCQSLRATFLTASDSVSQRVMTLIAQFAINGAPLLIGDVLLSSETKTGLKVNLPLVGDINEVLAKNGLPFEVMFTQKLNVLADRLVVAWSGPMIQAERALHVLSRISTRPNIKLDDIGRELDAIDKHALDRLQLVGILLGDITGSERTAHCFALGVKGINIPRLATVFAAGTGRDAFLKLLEKTDWTNSGTGNEYQVAHVLLGALTNEEYRTGQTILNRWGGGFEAVTCSQLTGRFEKVGDILHTFWRLSENADNSIEFTPMFYKTTYWKDALIIRAARLEKTGSNTFQLTRNDLTLVPPLLKQADDYDLSELGTIDFSYRAICCHVLIEKARGQDILLFVEQREHQRDLAFEFEGPSGRLHISSDLTKTIIEQARVGLHPH
jgi:hypothetical protein